MHDAGVRRHHLEVAERGLAPAQEHVALAVALELDFVVVLQRVGGAVFVDLHRVIDHQLGGRQRIDLLRIAAELDDGFAHGRQIHDAGHAGEILHDDSRRREGDFMARQRFRIPLEQRLDIAFGDIDAVLEAQQFSSRIFSEKGRRSTFCDLSAARLRISYCCAPTLSVVLALKLSVMTPPPKNENYK
jgi:hypothetical protein